MGENLPCTEANVMQMMRPTNNFLIEKYMIYDQFSIIDFLRTHELSMSKQFFLYFVEILLLCKHMIYVAMKIPNNLRLTINR